MSITKKILVLLLDRYERSSRYRGTAVINRGIRLDVKKKLAEYELENPEKKEAVHFAAGELEKKGLIRLHWMRFEEGNILNAIELNVDKVDEAYRQAGRTPKMQEIESAVQQTQSVLSGIRTGWIRGFLQNELESMERKKDFSRLVPEDFTARQLLFKTLEAVDAEKDQELSERIFSMEHLGDSKAFEKKVRNRLVAIAGKYGPDLKELDSHEILQSLGIVKSEEELLFKGPLMAELCGSTIDYGSFCYGASMNSETIKAFRVRALETYVVITIENKTSYYRYIKKNPAALVIYGGGFYSPVKILFLKKIHEFTGRAHYLHWGDIDLGGMRIFMHLKNKAIPELEPMLMDSKTLLEHAGYSSPMSVSYMKKLKKLLEDRSYGIFHELIKTMLENNMKLEQEAVSSEFIEPW